MMSSESPSFRYCNAVLSEALALRVREREGAWRVEIRRAWRKEWSVEKVVVDVAAIVLNKWRFVLPCGVDSVLLVVQDWSWN